MSKYTYGNSGHAKGHVRDAFCEAVVAFYRWRSGEPLPTVEFEDREITIDEAAGNVWRCNDILPSEYFNLIDHPPMRRTYAAMARFLRKELTRASAVS